jgi:hypothetical protein
MLAADTCLGALGLDTKTRTRPLVRTLATPFRHARPHGAPGRQRRAATPFGDVEELLMWRVYPVSALIACGVAVATTLLTMRLGNSTAAPIPGADPGTKGKQSTSYTHHGRFGTGGRSPLGGGKGDAARFSPCTRRPP